MIANKLTKENEWYPKWGEIRMAYLGEYSGNNQGGYRPIFVWSCDINNKHNPNINAYPLTSKLKAMHLPVHVLIKSTTENGLTKDSVALLEQPITLNKKFLGDYVGQLSEKDKLNIMKAILVQYQMDNKVKIIDDEVISTKKEAFKSINKIVSINYLQPVR